MTKTLKISVLALGLAYLSGAATADVMIGLADDRQIVYDSQWKSTNAYNDKNWYLRLGVGAQTIQRAGEFVFRLPEAVDENLTFTSAEFRVQLLSKTGAENSSVGPNPVPNFNLDLYAVRIADAPTVLTSDFYAGERDSNAILIMDNFITPDSPIRVSGNPNYITTDNEANERLTAFLNEAYAKGANAGKYIFLRLSPDYTTVTADMVNMNYSVLAGDAGNAAERPTITYTTVIPEPMTMGLVPLVGAMMLMPRRRAPQR